MAGVTRGPGRPRRDALCRNHEPCNVLLHLLEPLVPVGICGVPQNPSLGNSPSRDESV